MRSTVMSIFNSGESSRCPRLSIAGAVGDRFGLQAAMLLAVAGFGVGGMIWLLLPEGMEGTPQ